MTTCLSKLNSILIFGTLALLFSAMTVSGKSIVGANSVQSFFNNANQMANDHNKDIDCLTNN